MAQLRPWYFYATMSAIVLHELEVPKWYIKAPMGLNGTIKV